MSDHFLDSSKCEIAAAQEQRPVIIQLLYKSNGICEYDCEKTGSTQCEPVLKRSSAERDEPPRQRSLMHNSI